MLFQLALVPAKNGRRRHRFMESSDFNAAAFRILDSVRQAIVDGRSVGSCFFSAFMDPTTPGEVDTVQIPAVRKPPLLRVMELSPSLSSAVGLGLQALLHDADEPPSLAAYIRTAPTSSSNPESKFSKLLTLEIWSVDTAASASCRFDKISQTLQASPLEFRGRR